MNKLVFILTFMMSVQMAYSRQIVHLDSLYVHARNNYPNLKQDGIFNDISSLNTANHAANKLPLVMFNSQATYQSDVTGIELDVPGLSIPSASKDQYKIYAEFIQPVWDGGISDASVKIEVAILKANLSKLEVELYQLNEQVSQLFFAILAANKQKKALKAQKTTLLERLKITESGIRHGTAEKSAALIIQGEILNLTQGILHLQTVQSTSIQLLSLITGHSIEDDASFTYNIEPVIDSKKVSRPETELFSNRLIYLENQISLLQKGRNPKIMAFGQAGVGKPGLNMLSNKFEPYFLTGLKLTWNPLDWKKTSRQQQVLSLQQEVIRTEEETFERNLNILLLKQREEINRIEKVLETDKELVALRAEVTSVTASKLENEVITTADYIREVQAETIAILNFELHKIQLNEAYEKYKLIKGKT